MTSPEEFSCIFCKESFESKEELQIHFRKHGDPKFNPSVKNTKSKVQTEMAAGGEIGEEPEMVRCDVCEEEFPTISKAITHKHKVHPDHDAKYFCPWCGKLFTMKHLYNKHIQSVHESIEQRSGETEFHCDYCEVDFFIPSAMLYHNKFFHRQDTELAAIGHSRKLKMFSQEPLQIYYCPFCGEEYCNKVNLHKHMGDDHIDENQSPEDVLRCPLCDAVFYHLDAYELHLTFHSTDDMYGEENDMTKQITEFSLETVPPMMEKVENESQEDEPASTLGIEELLQQAMNESNGESVREKKKKHKKHKKSKNAAITLDEFLNMNSDVFGEGLDIQGIVEVPTQVVAKSLKRKPGPKPLPTELQKLKKAGLVIKKNPTSMRGVKITNRKPTIQPSIKVTQDNIISSKIIKATETTRKQDLSSNSNDVLSRLLNQGNSQIKIVKKSALGDSIAEVSATDKGSPENEDMTKSPEVEIPNEDKTLKDKSQATNSYPEKDSHIKKHEDEENIDKDEAFLSYDSSDFVKGIRNDKDTESNSKELNMNDLNQDENVEESNIVMNNTNLTKSQPITNTLDALRNISQHLTIKSLQSQNKDQKSTIADKIEQEEKNMEESEMEHKDEVQDTKAIQKDCEIYCPKANNCNQINPLKHLSHLTIKPVNQAKNITSSDQKTDGIYKTEIDEDVKTDNDIDNIIENKQADDDNLTNKTAMSVQNQTAKLEALRNLSKHVTIKSLSQSPNSPKNIVDKLVPDQVEKDDLNYDMDSEIDTGQVGQHIKQKDFINRPIVMKANIAKCSNVQSPSPFDSPKKIRVQAVNEVQIPKNQLTVKNEVTAQLKQFPNITAKPFNIHKTVKQSTFQTSCQSTNNQKENFAQNSLKKIETKQEEIEIFNIDDSDDEVPPSPLPTSRTPSNVKLNPVKNTTPKHVDNRNTNYCKNVLKNLSKHITIKSSNQGEPAKEEPDEKFPDEDPNSDCDGEFIDEGCNVKASQQNNTVLQNKLKNLSNLTVKSSNTSPKIPAITSKLKVNKKQMDEYDSDCSNTSGNVKITELPDDYTSDDDIPLKNIKSPNISNQDTTVPQYTDSECDNKEHHENDDDIESQIPPTMLKKPNVQTNKPVFLNNLKNITIKSSKDNTIQQEDDSPDSADENKVLVPYQPHKKHSIVSPFRPSTSNTQEQGSSYQVRQNIGRTVNQNISNRVNTVNKEVTVQKFQTKTVVQEITTTVTKTIRTINQTVKQEVRNATQSSSMPTPSQKVQGVRPQIRNFKGTPTRPAAPLMGTKIRQSTPTRMPGHTNIRPPNQLVQVRSGVNLARPNNPSMAGPRKYTQPSTSNASNSNVGKPLKISPNAMLNKRPATEEVGGPFSCFKKPKESLIPSADEEDSGANFGNSSLQTSQSNFTSTTKIMKGNSVMTSTQTKCGMSASSEQISKLNSMAGLKVVKTSQTKQASMVEERSEVSPAKRSAIEAIEKLKKQGLLVKKPKVDEPVVEEPDEHPNPEGDDYYDT